MQSFLVLGLFTLCGIVLLAVAGAAIGYGGGWGWTLGTQRALSRPRLAAQPAAAALGGKTWPATGKGVHETRRPSEATNPQKKHARTQEESSAKGDHENREERTARTV